MATAKVTSKGQITIPIEVRTALGLETGSRVEFVANRDGSYEIMPATRSIRDLKGVLRSRRHAVILREGGVSSTPRSFDSISGVSGILDHPPEPVIGRPFGRPGGG